MALGKFTLVHIRGLESEAGKKLNDGLGVVISDKVTTDSNGGERYAVSIFALNGTASRTELLEECGVWSILKATADKRLKVENLVPHSRSGPFGDSAVTCLNRAAIKYGDQAQAVSDHKAAFFWLKET